MKKIWPYIALTVVLGIVIILGLRLIAGEEDTWLCTNGEWVKHGEPSKAKPTSGCSLKNANPQNTNSSNTNTESLVNTNTALTDKETCEAIGGVWGLVGLSEGKVCNLPTSDGGKECIDGNNCETKICLANLTKEESEKFNQGETIEKKGKCPEWQITAGCYLLVEGGVAASTICFD